MECKFNSIERKTEVSDELIDTLWNVNVGTSDSLSSCFWN